MVVTDDVVLMVVVAEPHQVEALQKEVCVRTNQWLQQKQKEEELLSDLDVAVQRCLHTVSLDPPGQVRRGQEGRRKEKRKREEMKQQRWPPSPSCIPPTSETNVMFVAGQPATAGLQWGYTM